MRHFFSNNASRAAIVFLPVILFLIACDPGSCITFKIANESNGVVDVTYFEYDSNKVTQIRIPEHTEQILFQQCFLGYVDRFENQDSVDLSYHVRIWKDSVLLGTNLNDKQSWDYIRTNKSEAALTLRIK
ncbi:MAG TPA: hypothetical protein PLM90_09450 [Chitinophagales bacterium]|nr:hypothetical protein [Chitinophagales bacterium]